MTYFYDPDCQEALAHVRKQMMKVVKERDSALRHVEDATARYLRIRKAMENLEEACPDCGGGGCEWCGDTGFVFKDPGEMYQIIRKALK